MKAPGNPLGIFNHERQCVFLCAPPEVYSIAGV